MKVRDPRTPGEWQEAVNGAEFFLLVDSCKMHGLIDGGPEINAERCHEILKRGRERGVFPASHEKLIELYRGIFDDNPKDASRIAGRETQSGDG